ncbi:type I restriction enzyme R subunit [Yimella lutea]|uniref:Type I restriction enzyme R subunit n=1 Tax=Yimella lutea TaxID=587872 RepID=A0A542EGR8_9MICO|nr:type I restriction endonuclease [Yimella lutea]TQJ14532.1 type I restriction enzyme R subunit [Yimella lutea]
MSQVIEKAFEDELCAHLAAHGWLYSPNDDGYDRQRALFPEDVFAWLEDTQPEELAKKVKPSMSAQAQEKARDGILTRLATLLDKGQPVGGSLQVLRSGFKDTPASFSLMQKRPEQAINPTVNARYVANRLRVMRQVHYSTKNQNSIDLVLFVNGIPVATLELKTDFTQNVGDAKTQYMQDRPPAGEPLLGFGTRALVHFAVSNDEVWMTTKLAGDKTVFLPFNRGNDGHKGNGPDEDGGSATTYLWRDVLQRDQWLDIIGKFIHYETTKSTDEKTGQVSTKHMLIFPRFHQLDAVTKIVNDARTNGAGQRYLIQHSAGSGKTRSIAWSAHRLATLHNDQNEKVFDTVIVVTDRNVLDAQLQEAIKQIESKAGVVATISSAEASKKSFTSKSAYLTQTLSSGKLIIVVTIQTFPFVLEAIQENKALAGRKFAVIADEAHSSQTGQTATKLKQVLSDQEAADLEDGGEVDVEAILAADAKAKADTHNISFLAFTATPKAKTLEMFGTEGDDGLPRPFHTYTMAQAIEENFIHDVLRNYTTYSTAFELAKKVQGGQMQPVQRIESNGELVDESAATKGLMRWVKLHPTNIAQKVQVIIEHFEANVKPLLGGRAKAMVVTDSRKAAVRYKTAMDAYIQKMGYTDYTSLVAFSGEVVDPKTGPGPFTEHTMNPGVKDLRGAFNTDEYRVMIVANKFQTGFDQPLLCAMYVDRQLSGVTAVQTLSRLNRFVPGKKTMILDFVNNEEEILAAFKPYYEEARIVATTDPNQIHDLQTKLDTAGIYSTEELDAVVEAFVLKKGNNALAGAIQPIKQRFVARYNTAVATKDKCTVDELSTFRKDIGTYVRLYDFLSQILDFEDTDVEKHAVFCRLLVPHLRVSDTSERVDLSDVELVQIMQKETGKHSIDLGEGEVVPLRTTTAAGSKKSRDPRMVLLDEVIERINEVSGAADIPNHQKMSWIDSVIAAMESDEDLREQAVANNEDQFLISPTLRDALTLAVVETNISQTRMTQLFNEKGAIEKLLLEALGKTVYLDLQRRYGQGTTDGL